MESHCDRDSALPADFWTKLGERAGTMVQNRQSEITAGKRGEPVLAEWKCGDLHVVQRPADEQEILRISIGGGISLAHIDYCVFRGDRTRCACLLEEAAKALRDGPH